VVEARFMRQRRAGAWGLGWIGHREQGSGRVGQKQGARGRECR
jgi:hypothetical protein